jgi:hypothetical protein
MDLFAILVQLIYTDDIDLLLDLWFLQQTFIDTVADPIFCLRRFSVTGKFFFISV